MLHLKSFDREYMDCGINGRQRELLELTGDRGLKVPIITLYGLGESFSPSFSEEVVEIMIAKANWVQSICKDISLSRLFYLTSALKQLQKLRPREHSQGALQKRWQKDLGARGSGSLLRDCIAPSHVKSYICVASPTGLPKHKLNKDNTYRHDKEHRGKPI